MQKSKGIRIAAIICGAIVVVAGIVLMVSHFFKKEDAYRSILVYELEGTAEIERENKGSIRAAENIYLESGDRLTVADDSYMRLKLDDDKYIMVEENTILSIEAVGTEEDSKTKIELVQGAITSEIQNPLSTDSEYEVTSPNSVMAVRGTIFRVETGDVQGDTAYTKTSVFSGKVSMGVRLPDGTTGDEIFVGAGEEGYGEGNNPIETSEIDYSALPPQALRGLQELLEQGAPIKGITQSELSELVERSENTDDKDESEKTEETTDRKDSETAESTTENRGDSKPSSGSTGTRGQSGNTGTAGNTSTEPSGSNTANETPAGTTGQPGNNSKPTEHKTDTKKTEYTVTFMYQGKVFATQTVTDGQCAKQPTLRPAAFGTWDFDFSTKITKTPQFIGNEENKCQVSLRNRQFERHL